MSSRKEEKERLREERLAREAEAQASERRRRMLGFGVGGALALAAIVAVVVAIAAGGGGGDSKDKPKTPSNTAPIPAQKESDLKAAAKAAGCTVRSFTPGSNDRGHVENKVQYKQNPPVFGPHDPTWAQDGDYAGSGAPETEKLVHALEHGRVVIWYKPTLAPRQVSQLETLFSEPISGKPSGYKQILADRSSLPGAVAASGWGQQIVCPQFDDKVFDALRAFRAAYVDKGPESVPFPE